MNTPASSSVAPPPDRALAGCGSSCPRSERHGAWEEAIAATAELLNLTDSQMRIAARYYGAFPDEIDRRIAFNPEDAEAAWQREQAALA